MTPKFDLAMHRQIVHRASELHKKNKILIGDAFYIAIVEAGYKKGDEKKVIKWIRQYFNAPNE